jgi:hypothetical protein
MPRKSRNSRKSLKGGNSTSFPSEYYGNESGRYHDVVPAQESVGPYGEYVGQSFGEPYGDNMTGPNLFYHPNTSNTMTGGRRRRRRSIRSKKSKKSKKSRHSTKRRCSPKPYKKSKRKSKRTRR